MYLINMVFIIVTFVSDSGSSPKPKKIKRGRKVKLEREEDRELIKRLKTNDGPVERSERQQRALEALNVELSLLSGSSAKTEHLFQCGLCMEVKKICAGRVAYFKKKHYDYCQKRNSGIKDDQAQQMQGMREGMAAFLGRNPIQEPVQPIQDIGMDEQDPDLIPGGRGLADPDL
jgi:hypothetical protein